MSVLYHVCIFAHVYKNEIMAYDFLKMVGMLIFHMMKIRN